MSEGVTTTPSPTDIAWAAGLFEGEGSVFVRGRKDRKYTYLQVAMTDKDVIERFAAIMGCGTIRDRKDHLTKRGLKPAFEWQVGAWLDVQRIINDFWPYLGMRRRRKAVECLSVDTRAEQVGT